MTPAQLIAQARTLVTAYLRDTCDLINITSAQDGFGGQTSTRVAVASDIRCLYEAERDLPGSVEAGTITSPVRHKVFLELSADVQDIAPDWEIVVAARDDKPELTFVDPRRMDESNEVLLTVRARLKE